MNYLKSILFLIYFLFVGLSNHAAFASCETTCCKGEVQCCSKEANCCDSHDENDFTNIDLFFVAKRDLMSQATMLEPITFHAVLDAFNASVTKHLYQQFPPPDKVYLKFNKLIFYG